MEIKKQQEQSIAKKSGLKSSLVVITKPEDLLSAKPMVIMVKDFGKAPIIAELIESVDACCIGLNISMDRNQTMILAEDLYEVYAQDSLEVVIECLNNGRRGKYGFGHNSRNSLNMILIREWMTQQLDVLALEREKRHNAQKDITKKPLEEIDYNAYKTSLHKETKQRPAPVKLEPREQRYYDPQKYSDELQAKLILGKPLTDEEQKWLKSMKAVIIDNKITYEY